MWFHSVPLLCRKSDICDIKGDIYRNRFEPSLLSQLPTPGKHCRKWAYLLDCQYILNSQVKKVLWLDPVQSFDKHLSKSILMS